MPKRIMILLLSLLVCAVMLAGCGGDKGQGEQEVSVDLGETVIQFEKDLQEAQKPALDAIEDFASQAEGSAEDARQAASVARDECKQAQQACFKIETPEGAGEVGVLLDSIKLELSTAYMLKAEAFESALAYLDNDKRGDLQSYEDKIADADRFVQSAANYLAEAKGKAGVE